METTTPLYGPLIEQTMFLGGVDSYKPNMSQLEYQKYPEAEVTFTLKIRGDQRLADFVTVDTMQKRLDFIRDRQWTPADMTFLSSLERSNGQPLYGEEFLKYLSTNDLPPVKVRFDAEKNDIAIDTAGAWPLVTFWETIVMSEASEAYFEGMIRAQGIDIMELYEEGDRRLSKKIEFLQANPDIKVAEFGTRRRFSLRWQHHVLTRLKNECPDNLLGTSNLAFASTMGLKPSGTNAHELPMVYAGIADAQGEDIRASHGQVIDDWHDMYEDELSVALSDTFGSDFFFEDLTLEQATRLKATRQDSGDPFRYADKAEAFYESKGIDPLVKTVFFSDNLTMDKVSRIHDYTRGRMQRNYGIGTHLTNDLGLKALNDVMKATHVRLPDGREADLVKLSDDPGKHTGPEALVERYQRIFATAQKGNI